MLVIFATQELAFYTILSLKRDEKRIICYKKGRTDNKDIGNNDYLCKRILEIQQIHKTNSKA